MAGEFQLHVRSTIRSILGGVGAGFHHPDPVRIASPPPPCTDMFYPLIKLYFVQGELYDSHQGP